MIVVSDTSPISNLLLIGQLHLLPAVYGKVVIPPAVLMEVEALAQFGIDLSPFRKADWIQQAKVPDTPNLQLLLKKLDLGEAEAIVLAEELNADFLLIDERLGWREAQKRGVKTVGLLGTLVMAKEKGVIAQVKPLIDALKQKTKFRMSEELVQHVLKIAGELA